MHWFKHIARGLLIGSLVLIMLGVLGHNAVFAQAARRTGIVEVKFKNGLGVRARAGSLTGLSTSGASQFAQLLRTFPIESITPVFTLSNAQLNQLRLNGEQSSGKSLPDLRLWFRFKLKRAGDTDAFIAELEKMDGVEIAQELPLPAPPAATTPDFTADQGYEDAATDGIGARLAWTVAGGTGANVTIYDVEYNWLQTHEDLDSANGVTLLLNSGDSNSPPGFSGCPAPCDSKNREHGTAVLGELISTRDSIGVTGIAYDARIGLAPANTTNLGYNLGNAIALATVDAGANSTQGDLILLEQQTVVCGLADGAFGPSYGPVEAIASVKSAIQTAVANGIIVVEAAGNGGVDLDQSACGSTFSTANDSGAIIVGAGQAPATGNDRERHDYSSYGATVDLQGWGGSVRSTGYGNFYSDPDNSGDATKWYTSFSGTSSASPIVTGAAALMQSIAIQQNGAPMTPAQIRQLLINTGSAQQGTTSEHIGPRPNLAAAIATVQNADVSVSLNDGPDPVIAGNSMTYSITVTNQGPGIAQNVVLTDSVPANTTYVSFNQNTGPSFTCSGTSTVTCNIASLGNGVSATFTLAVDVSSSTPDGTILSNTPTVSADNDSNAGNNSDTETTTVETSADLFVSKTHSVTGVAGAGQVEWTITVINNGPSDAASVSLADTLDATTSEVSASASAGGICSGDPTVTCTWTTIPTGQSRTVTIVADLHPDALNLCNDATGATATNDPILANNTGHDCVTVPTKSDLSIVKTSQIVGSGRSILYTIRIQNNGPSVARNVRMIDKLVQATNLKWIKTPQGTCKGDKNIKCKLGNVAFDTEIIQIQVEVVHSVANVKNTANVKTKTNDPAKSNNTSTVNTALGGTP